MRKLWLAAVLMTPLQLIHAQEVHHAPTVEQCRADQRLWQSKLQEHDLANVGYKELDSWFDELVACRPVDPNNEKRYFDTAFSVIGQQFGRHLHFLYRHNLYGQFLAEDAQGMR
jgi:hypothetical protein